MRRGGRDEPLEVREQRVERLARDGRIRRQCACDIARADRRKHRVPLRVVQVAGDPVDDRAARTAEVLAAHVGGSGRGDGSGGAIGHVRARLVGV